MGQAQSTSLPILGPGKIVQAQLQSYAAAIVADLNAEGMCASLGPQDLTPQEEERLRSSCQQSPLNIPTVNAVDCKSTWQLPLGRSATSVAVHTRLFQRVRYVCVWHHMSKALASCLQLYLLVYVFWQAALRCQSLVLVASVVERALRFPPCLSCLCSGVSGLQDGAVPV